MVTLGLFPGQTGGTEAVLHRIQGNLHLVAYSDFQSALIVEKLIFRNYAFGFESGVNDHRFVGDFQHSADDDCA